MSMCRMDCEGTLRSRVPQAACGARNPPNPPQPILWSITSLSDPISLKIHLIQPSFNLHPLFLLETTSVISWVSRVSMIFTSTWIVCFLMFSAAFLFKGLHLLQCSIPLGDNNKYDWEPPAHLGSAGRVPTCCCLYQSRRQADEPVFDELIPSLFVHWPMLHEETSVIWRFLIQTEQKQARCK